MKPEKTRILQESVGYQLLCGQCLCYAVLKVILIYFIEMIEREVRSTIQLSSPMDDSADAENVVCGWHKYCKVPGYRRCEMSLWRPLTISNNAITPA